MRSHNLRNVFPAVIVAFFAFLPAATAAAVIHETATFVQAAAAGGYDLRDNQMAGTRFTVSQTTEVTAIGGQLFATGTLFGAIVTLGVDDLPIPNPGEPSAISGIQAITTFSTNSIQHTDYRTPLSTTLAPGTYGLVFGGVDSGLSGRMALTGTPLSGAKIFTNAGGFWQDNTVERFNGMRFVIEGQAVPEPTTALLMQTVGIALLFHCHRCLLSRDSF